MYLCHFTVFRTDGRQATSAACARRWTARRTSTSRCACCRELRDVVRLPRPYYHWRAWSESTALTIDAKPWAQDAAARVQQAHLDRTFGGGTVGPERGAAG